MKLKLILVCLLVLIIGGNAFAETSDSLALDSDLQSAQESNNMTWPMLPGENLNDVARMFYPKNVVMQRLFVSKTLRLNSGKANLTASNRFKEPTLLVIPTLKALSKKSQLTQVVAQKARKHRLQITTDFESILDSVPSKLKEEYEYWVNKNKLLQQQLGILKEKIVLLEKKLNNLTLIWEKTLSQSAGDSVANNAGAHVTSAPDISANDATAASNAVATSPTIGLSTNEAAISTGNVSSTTNTTPGKKVFKNLNASKPKTSLSPAKASKVEVPKVEATKDSSGLLDYLNTDWAKAALAAVLLAIAGAFLLKKYRERMFAKMSFVATQLQATVQETIVDFGGYLKPRLPEPEDTPEAKQQAQAAKEVEARLDSTLAEAKLLMSVNRHQDAIVHLKQTIESQPKASINHWLYLLEIFRKLNLKDDFEAYAKGLHDIYNVMTPVWYETEIPIFVPQSLEEFPHIIEKLCSVWPGDLATVYLRGLITDNRGGDRTGFGKAVLNEILMLVAVLDHRKDLT
jgi:hypothetical protein